MIKKVYLAGLMLTILVACSCGKIKCRNEPINLVFSGYDTVTLEKVILTKYIKGTSFSQILDTLISGTAYTDYSINDTGLQLSNMTYGIINSDFDWTVFIARTQRTYWIKDVHFQQRSIKGCVVCEKECINNCTYYINDSLREHSGDPANRLFIHIFR